MSIDEDKQKLIDWIKQAPRNSPTDTIVIIPDCVLENPLLWQSFIKQLKKNVMKHLESYQENYGSEKRES